MKKEVVDVMGQACPIPVVKTKKTISAMNGEGIVETHVDNETAVENLKRLGSKLNVGVSDKKIDDKHFVVEFSIDGAAADGASDAEESKTSNVVYSIGSDKMGAGDDKLGTILMKSFIYSVSQLEQPPAKMIFFNAGAKLTAEGSDSLEDLKTLEEMGTKMITCGTCADFFGVKEQVKVGIISNMYEIVESLDGAEKLVRI